MDSYTESMANAIVILHNRKSISEIDLYLYIISNLEKCLCNKLFIHAPKSEGFFKMR